MNLLKFCLQGVARFFDGYFDLSPLFPGVVREVVECGKLVCVVGILHRTERSR